ncbi:MAG: hypothetical protein H0T43_12550 [Solirubrobacterales bacterium]|nr:hypothetical protein [Solirubrobacterales bacterium]
MPGVAQRLRLARHRGRVRASGGGVMIGPGVHFDVAPGAEVRLGAGCVLGERTRVLVRAGRVSIGAGAILGERCTLVAHGAITIGERARLGDGAVVVDFDHVFDDVERPIRLQPIESAPVTIGDGALIGIGASVLRGVTVGARAVVGPHAVVTADVGTGAHVAGVPARPAMPAGHGSGAPPSLR